MSASGTGPVMAAAIAPIIDSTSRVLAAQANAEAPALPAGFPAQLRAKLAWSGSDFPDASDYTLELDDVDKLDIIAAVKHFKCGPPTISLLLLQLCILMPSSPWP